MKKRQVLVTWVVSTSSFITSATERTTYAAAITSRHIVFCDLIFVEFVATVRGQAAMPVDGGNEIIFTTSQGTAALLYRHLCETNEARVTFPFPFQNPVRFACGDIKLIPKTICKKRSPFCM